MTKFHRRLQEKNPPVAKTSRISLNSPHCCLTRAGSLRFPLKGGSFCFRSFSFSAAVPFSASLFSGGGTCRDIGIRYSVTLSLSESVVEYRYKVSLQKNATIILSFFILHSSHCTGKPLSEEKVVTVSLHKFNRVQDIVRGAESLKVIE